MNWLFVDHLVLFYSSQLTRNGQAYVRVEQNGGSSINLSETHSFHKILQLVQNNPERQFCEMHKIYDTDIGLKNSFVI